MCYYPFGMLQPGRKTSFGLYRYGFQGQEKSDELKGEGNSYSAEFWEYDPRVGRRWNVDPVFKDYESPYAAFSNNPIWNVDPDGADTAKYLTNSELADGVRIAYTHLRKQTDAKKFKAGRDESEALLAKVEDYAKTNNLGLGSTIELGEVVNRYYEGLEEIALASKKAFNDLGDKILNDDRVSNTQKVIQAAKAIQAYNGKALAIVTYGANTAVGLAVGGLGIKAGPGPKGIQTPPVVTRSPDMGRIIGWGEGQTQASVQTTQQITRNLTRAQVQAFRNQGLTKAWVKEQQATYGKALLNPAKVKNVNLQPRKELMDKILYLWDKK